MSEIKLNKYGYMDVDPYTLMTSKPGVFVGGDAVSGGGTIIEAINAGKVAAKYMDKYLRGEPVVEDLEDKTRRLAVVSGRPGEQGAAGRQRRLRRARRRCPWSDPEVRKHNFDADRAGLHAGAGDAEADRCLRCHRPIVVVA